MRATIGITSGDPAGIGLEVTFKSLPEVLSAARWVLFTDRSAFERNYARFGQGCPVRWIGNLSEVADYDGAPVLFVYGAAQSTSTPVWGEISAAAGQSALTCLE